MNSILQALVSCVPFQNILFFFSMNQSLLTQSPTLEKFVSLYNDLKSENCQSSNAFVSYGKPLSLNYFEDLLHLFDPDALGTSEGGSKKPKYKQQDAQEFLTFVLDNLHEELIQYCQLSIPEEKDGDGWLEINKNKVSNVTKMEIRESPITRIFSSRLRSAVHEKSNSILSANVQPYNCLPLDIRKITSIESALSLFLSREDLDDFTNAKTKYEVQASKQTTIERLPMILILQLKRFMYEQNVLKKLDKFVSFPERLTLGKRLLTNPRLVPDDHQRTFQLFALVSHHGPKPIRGHYTCDVLWDDQWFFIDDTKVIPVTVEEILNERTPYLLFYQNVALTSVT